MNKLSIVGVVAGVAAGATVLVLTANIIPGRLAFNVHITADIVMIDGKQIALDKRMDASRTNLTPIEQKVLTNALFYPAIMDILIQKEKLYIQKIVRANTDTECESD